MRSFISSSLNRDSLVQGMTPYGLLTWTSEKSPESGQVPTWRGEHASCRITGTAAKCILDLNWTV